MSLNKHYAVYLGYAVLNVSISYALLLFLANRLSIADYALYGVISSVAGLALIALNFGHKEALFKFESQSNDEELKRLAASLKPWLFGALVLCLAALIVNPLLGLAGLSFLGVYGVILAAGAFRGKGLYAQDAASWPLYRGLWLVGGLLVVVLTGRLDLSQVFVASVVASILALLFLKGGKALLILMARSPEPRLPFSNPTLVSFFWLELATVAYLKLDVILLKALGAPDADIAGYFFALQIFEAAMLGLAPLAYLFFNRINAQSSAISRALTLRPFLAGAAIMSALILVGWWWLGSVLLETMFPNYLGSFGITFWLLLALFPMAVNMLLSHWLFADHKERIYARICACALVLCFGLNLWLIPLQGAVGAAWSRGLTELGILGLLLAYFWFVRRRQLDL